MKGAFLGSWACHASTIVFCPALAALINQVQIFFFSSEHFAHTVGTVIICKPFEYFLTSCRYLVTLTIPLSYEPQQFLIIRKNA
jgi:hypothetical protein